MKTKKEKIQAIKEDLERNSNPDGWMKNIGKTFFSYNFGPCVLRDLVYYLSCKHEFLFEFFALDSCYFVGTREHALALKEAFGGEVTPSECVAFALEPRELYIWEKPVKYSFENGHWVNPNPIDFNEAVEALFS